MGLHIEIVCVAQEQKSETTARSSGNDRKQNSIWEKKDAKAEVALLPLDKQSLLMILLFPVIVTDRHHVISERREISNQETWKRKCFWKTFSTSHVNSGLLKCEHEKDDGKKARNMNLFGTKNSLFENRYYKLFCLSSKLILKR